MIGADSKAVKRVLDGVSKVAPGLSFMGFSAEGPGASGKLLVFNNVVGVTAEVRPDNVIQRRVENASSVICIFCLQLVVSFGIHLWWYSKDKAMVRKREKSD